MQDWQQRVVDEKKELDNKIGRLTQFTQTQEFQSLPLPETDRLVRQLNAMEDYSEILGERIAAFEGELRG